MPSGCPCRRRINLVILTAGRASKKRRPGLTTTYRGRGVDHYHRYEEDFAILKSLNMNAFRFCIEWARIEPQEGAWDAAAIAHYRTYLRTLKKMGITPVVTLFHFTLPEWFAAKGGFEKRRNIKYFVYYVEKVLSELGRDIEWIVTINEPTVYAGESYLEGHWPRRGAEGSTPSSRR